MAVVAGVKIDIDTRGADQKLRSIQQSSANLAKSFGRVQQAAAAVRSAVESQQGSYAKASTVQGVFSARVLSTEKAIRAQIAALRDVQSSVKLNGALYQKAGAQIAQYEALLSKANNTQSRSVSSAGALLGTIGKLAIAYVGLRTAQSAVQAGIQREESERRLQFLAQGYNEVAQAQEIAARAGARFGLSATESNQAFAQLYGRLRPLNVTIEDIEAAFVGFNTAAKVSGATTAESAGALLQLTQALGSGVLRGQELNSVLEQAPGLVVALTKELNAPVSEIRKLAEEGKITSDVVIRALKRAGTDGADQLAAAMNGPAQAVKDLQNEFEDFQVAATTDLVPAVISVVRALRNALEELGPTIRGVGAIAASVVNTIAGLVNRIVDITSGGRRAQAEIQARAQAQQATRERFGLRALSPEAQQFRQQYERNILFNFDAQERERRRPAPAALTSGGALPPPVTLAKPPSTTRTGGRTGADKAAADAKRLADELARSREQGEQLARTFSRQAILLDTASETERKRLQIGFDYEDRQRQIAELKDKEQRVNLTQISQELRRVELRQLDLQVTRDQLAAFEKIAGISFANTEGLGARAFRRAPADPTAGFGMDALLAQTPAEQQMATYRAELDALTNPINMAVTGANAIGDAFGAAFQDIATGAKTTQEALADTFKAIGQAFISMAAQIIAKQLAMIAFQTILKALGGGGGGLFSGAGPYQMPSGGGFMEGFTGANFFAEGGFVTGPTQALIGEGGEPEYVIPQSKMASAMARYSRGARGEAVIPSSGGGDAAGGGAAASPAPIDVRYSVERINSVDYVTADQFQQGMAQAAQQGALQGERRALRTMQNSAATRKRIGV